MWNEKAWKVIVDQSDAVEFDWYGVDRIGNLAAFSTFGRGVMPQCCKQSREDYNRLYDLVSALPLSSESELVFEGTGKYDDWIAYSRQGLFGYDYQDAHRRIPHGQFDLITRPITPLAIDKLQLEPDLLRLIPFVNVEFGLDPTLPFDRFPR